MSCCLLPPIHRITDIPSGKIGTRVAGLLGVEGQFQVLIVTVDIGVVTYEAMTQCGRSVVQVQGGPTRSSFSTNSVLEEP